MSSTSRWARARSWAIAASGAAALATVAVGVMPAGAAAPRTGRTVNATYSCKTSITGSNAYTFTVGLAGVAPKTALPGKTVNVTGVQISVNVSATLVNQARSLGVKSIGGSTKLVDLNASDAKSKTDNIASKGIKFPTVTLVANKAVTFKVPAAPITAAWTSGTKGVMSFTDGNATLNLIANTSNGALPVTVTCVPKPVATFGKTTVS